MSKKTVKKTNAIPVIKKDDQEVKRTPLTKLERLARKEYGQSVRISSVSGMGMGGGGYGGGGMNGSFKDADSAFYSPQLSTDFLELPQSEREKRELFRFWYNSHPIIGAAIDFHCFPPGAPVTLTDGTTKPIESLVIGDGVLNGIGESTTVLRTFEHDINGPAVKFKVRGIQEDITCTENHPFLVYRAKQIDCKYENSGTGACKSGTKSICKAKNCSGVDFGEPEFVFSKDLRIGDYICSTSISKSEDNDEFNKEKLRILGYYAAEGSLSRTKNGHLDRVVFTLDKAEINTIAIEISELFKNQYDGESRVKEVKNCEACNVKCYKRELAEFCYKHVGSGSKTKKLSSELMNLPREMILEFLGAYWNGDGSLTKNGYVASTSSEYLADQIFMLALKVGYIPTKHKIPLEKLNKNKKGFQHSGPRYQIIIPFRFYSEFSKYANFVNDGYKAKSTRVYTIKIGRNVLRRIEKIETIHYEGKVYNIEVEGVEEKNTKSYIAYGLSTHNTDVPLSKIRLSLPKGSDLKRNKQILHFYEQMCKRIKLFQRLYDATHQYWLHGICYIFAEDHDMSEDIQSLIPDNESEEVDTEAIKKKVEENYKGWVGLQILPPEQVKMEVFQYTNKTQMELIPSEKDRQVVMKAMEENDPASMKIAESIPDEIRENIISGLPIPLNTSPYDDFSCSSFCYCLAHKKSPYEARSVSLLERCLRTLLFQDKLRQAQTLIASRAMTPKRVVWADKMSELDVDNLRLQVEQSLIDPDYAIVTNFEVHWDEIGAKDRLLDLNSEYEITNKLLFIGLRITESMLTGESSYSGDRIRLDTMNTMYLLYRETVAEYVEEMLFAPVAEKKGFFEIDEYGNKVYLYPKLQFTRLALRDNTELQDFMFNLYQKGSLPIEHILDLLNIDSSDTLEKLKKDMFTPNDANFNELIRGMLTKAGDELVDKTNILEVLTKNLNLKKNTSENGRFEKD